jgi:quercetin dioxygenase-like cupin family protein
MAYHRAPCADDAFDDRLEGAQHMQRSHDSGRPDAHDDAGFWVQPEEASGMPTAIAFEPRFYEVDALPGFSPIPGIHMNVMVGGQMMANWVRIAPGAAVPTHAHHHEQIGLVLEGEIIMTIGSETRTLVPGHAYTIPGNLPHSAEGGPNGCLVLDIFCPPREEYLAAAGQQ